MHESAALELHFSIGSSIIRAQLIDGPGHDIKQA